MKKALFLLFVLFATAGTTFAQSFFPTVPAQGFNVFTSGSITATAGDTHGPVAMGGDLILKGSTIFAMNTSGTYPTGILGNYNNYGMVIGKKVQFKSGNNSQLNQGFLRLGNSGGAAIWEKDNNNTAMNLKITKNGNAHANGTSIQLQRQQPAGTVTLPHGIDFTAAFSLFHEYSKKINEWNTVPDVSARLHKITIPNTMNPHIVLADNKVNFINLTGEQLANLKKQGSIIFDNKPAPNRILVFNIQAPGAFAWSTPNMGGISESDGSFIFWNFYQTTSLTLGVGGGESTYGTLFAPAADVEKIGGNNTNGQVIANSLVIAYGEIHYWPFAGALPDISEEHRLLPLRSMVLNAELQGGKVKLRWNVEGESEIESYTVERSNNGHDFTTAALVLGAGNHEQFAYHYTDNGQSVQVPVVYYRIRAQEANGKSYYSKVVAVRLSPDAAQVTVWPNPFAERITISYAAAAGAKATVHLFNNEGRLVKQAAFTVAKGANQLRIDNLQTLPSGMYVVKITDEGGKAIATQKIFK